MAVTFFSCAYVDFCLEIGVRRYGAGGGKNLTADEVFFVGSAKKKAGIVACLNFVNHFTEHFRAGERESGCGAKADSFDGVAHANPAAFNTPRDNGAAPGDGENILDCHQERLLVNALVACKALVTGIQKFHDFILVVIVAFKSPICGTADDRGVVSVKTVLAQ